MMRKNRNQQGNLQRNPQGNLGVERKWLCPGRMRGLARGRGSGSLALPAKRLRRAPQHLWRVHKALLMARVGARRRI